MSAPVVIDHPDGRFLEIRGAAEATEPSVLEWDGPADAIYIGAGCVLGFMGRLQLRQIHPARRGAGSGLLADEGGVARCGPDVLISGFYYGFTARRNGVLRVEGSRCEAAGDAGYFAFMGGQISAARSFASGAADPERPLGSGYVAEYGGSIDAADATSVNNKLAGFTALSGGSIRAYGARASGNRRAAFLVATGGSITAHRAVLTRDCGQHLLDAGGGHFSGNNVARLEGYCR